MDHSLDKLLWSDSDRSVGVPPHEHGAPSTSPLEFLQPLDLGPQTSDHSIDELLGPDSDRSVEALPQVRGAPSPSLLDPPILIQRHPEASGRKSQPPQHQRTMAARRIVHVLQGASKKPQEGHRGSGHPPEDQGRQGVQGPTRAAAHQRLP